MFGIVRKQFVPKFFRSTLVPEQFHRTLSGVANKTPSDIILVGSVHSEIRQISPDTKQFYLKTFKNLKNYTVHNIYLKQSLWDGLNLDIKGGEQLMVFGNIRDQRFDRKDGKSGSAIRVKVRHLYRCDTFDAIPQSAPSSQGRDSFSGDDVEADERVETYSSPLDVNRVELSAQICFEIKHFETYSVLNLAHHFRGSMSREEVIMLSVFVQDPNLREYVKNNLKYLDYVQLRGSLVYKPYFDKGDKKRFDGRIEAESISKMIRFPK